jgi:hypothetical protein
MNAVSDLDNGAISFAERVLTLLNQGRFVSTLNRPGLIGG